MLKHCGPVCVELLRAVSSHRLSFLSVQCVALQRSFQLICLLIIPQGRCCLQICTVHGSEPGRVISVMLKGLSIQQTSFRRRKIAPRRCIVSQKYIIQQLGWIDSRQELYSRTPAAQSLPYFPETSRGEHLKISAALIQLGARSRASSARGLSISPVNI